MLEFVNARMGSDHTIVVRSSVFRRESVTKLFLPSFWLNIQNNGLLLEEVCGMLTRVMKSTCQSNYLRLTNLGLLSGQGRFVM